MKSFLSKGGCLLLAVMSGGDYSPCVPNCGPSTALALARCGFGDTLLKAAETLHGKAFEDFLSTWRQKIQQELTCNSQSFLTSRQPEIAAQLTANFPSHEVLNLYVYPLTSWSPGETQPKPNIWKSREPQIFNISCFCSQNLGWTTNQDIARHFYNTLWKGVFFRMTSSVIFFSHDNITLLTIFKQLGAIFDEGTRCLATPFHRVWLEKVEFKSRKGKAGRWARLKILIGNLLRLTGRNVEPVAEDGSRFDEVLIWLPDSYLPALTPTSPSKKSKGSQSKAKGKHTITSYTMT